MPIVGLDHVNLRVADVAASIRFYADLLGMTATTAPGMGGLDRAAWLVDAGGRPVLHIVHASVPTPTMPDPGPALGGSGAVDHIAFDCRDHEAMLARIAARGMACTRNRVASAGLRQIFVRDPDDILVELNFREAGPA